MNCVNCELCELPAWCALRADLGGHFPPQLVDQYARTFQGFDA
ncbi:hypothetical protein OG912_39635 (plasmid) [Streptomyces sp. NBC_00464]